MASKHHPHRGSHGFGPRKRSEQTLARFRTWPSDASEEPAIQGFIGFKAGMTHVMMVDYRPSSTTAGQEVRAPVTVLETPPLGIAGVRVYRETTYGAKTAGEVWASGLDPQLGDRVHLSNKKVGSVDAFDPDKVDDVFLLAYNKPYLVPGIPRKVPDLAEVRVTGGDIPARLAFAGEKLGGEVAAGEFTGPGEMVDIAAVTKGKGLQGSPKRFGVKLQSHKNSKNRRDASPLGPFQPRFIRSTVPRPGQTGYHQRTEYNKRVLKIGENGEEITPAGGFLHYGNVANPYVLLHGSIPGPVKRAVFLRHAMRYKRGVKVDEPQLTYVSTASQQGV